MWCVISVMHVLMVCVYEYGSVCDRVVCVAVCISVFHARELCMCAVYGVCALSL